LQRAVDFYCEAMGLAVKTVGTGAAGLGPSEDPGTMLHFVEEPGAPPRGRATAGLFHWALLHPSRAALAAAVRRLLDRGGEVFGYVDHGASEAVYLADPDGNGLELAADRPATSWPYEDGRLAMYSRRRDLDELLAHAGEVDGPVRIGHLHLRVRSLEASTRFYRDLLGLQATQTSIPGAVFLARGAYHHHLALNTWGAPVIGLAPEGAVGLTAVYTAGGLPDGETGRTDPDGLVVHGGGRGRARWRLRVGPFSTMQ
jgi:catechol 2,3-dioxygenase